MSAIELWITRTRIPGFVMAKPTHIIGRMRIGLSHTKSGVPTMSEDYDKYRDRGKGRLMPDPKDVEKPFQRTRNTVKLVKELMSGDTTFVRAVADMYFIIRDGTAKVVDYEELPEEERENRRFSHKRQSLSRNPSLKGSREVSYQGDSPEKIANRASDNPYILSDILSDPGLVDADGETEAVAKVADQNPGWAKMSDAVEAHGLDVDADGNVSPSADSAGESGGESTGAAEAASEAASYSGDVSTADAGDLGPTGPSGYGIDGGSGGDAGGGGNSGGDGSGIGGDAGGGDL
jgi:hypothetical protein